MKDILHFLELQELVDNGLTQEQIKAKIDSLQPLDENPDMSERDFYRKRKQILNEIEPHRKNRREYKNYLNYFAGKITSMDFTPKSFLKWKSEEKRQAYISEYKEWDKERNMIIETMTVPEILKKFIAKEKEAMSLRIESLNTEVKIFNSSIDKLNAIDNLITFSEDVKSFNNSEPLPLAKKIRKNNSG
ncbi:hypothetical protein ACU6ZE_00395 [Klebsiella aerogenes]